MENLINKFKKKKTEVDSDTVLPAVISNEDEFAGARHEWTLVGRSYAAPVRNIPQQLTDIPTLERAMFGVTTLVFLDSLTGTIRKEQLIGSDENQLPSYLEKAENYGIQYIPYNGKKFAIALVPSEETISVK